MDHFTSTTYTLDQLLAYAESHGYPTETERLRYYRTIRNAPASLAQVPRPSCPPRVQGAGVPAWAGRPSRPCIPQ